MIINGRTYEKITTKESLGSYSKYILLYEDTYDHPDLGIHGHGYLEVKTRRGELPNIKSTKDLILISEKKGTVLPYGYSIVHITEGWVLSTSRGWKLWGEMPIIDLDEDDADCI